MRRIIGAARIIHNTQAIDTFIQEVKSSFAALGALAGPGSPEPDPSVVNAEEERRALELSVHHISELSVLYRQLEALMVTSSAHLHDHYLTTELASASQGEEMAPDPPPGQKEQHADGRETQAVETARMLAVSEVCCATGLGDRLAHKLVQTSSNIGVLPEVNTILWCGKITLTQAENISKGADSLTGTSLTAYDRELAHYVGGTTLIRSPRALRTKVARVRAKYGIEDQETRHRNALETRGVYLDNDWDGIATLVAKLPAESAHAIYNSLTDISLSAKQQGDTRTLEQLRADALVGLFLTNPNTLEQQATTLRATATVSPSMSIPGMAVMRERPTQLLEENTWISSTPFPPNLPPPRTQKQFNANANPAPDRDTVGVRAVINVYVPASTLTGESEEPAVLAGYGPVPPSVARKLASRADTLYRIMTDPATGKVLGQGRRAYKVSTQTREYLKLLSDTCEFPCCNVYSYRTDADHIIPWDKGGRTDPDNLQLLCRKHHNLKTKHGWTARRNPNGTTTWTSPLNNTYTTTKESQTTTTPEAVLRPNKQEKPPF